MHCRWEDLVLPTSNRNYGINDTKIHDYNSIDNNYGNKLKSSSIKYKQQLTGVLQHTSLCGFQGALERSLYENIGKFRLERLVYEVGEQFGGRLCLQPEHQATQCKCWSVVVVSFSSVLCGLESLVFYNINASRIR